MKKNEYECALCKETFKKERSEKEARQEYKENFGLEIEDLPIEIICDDCYKKIIL